MPFYPYFVSDTIYSPHLSLHGLDSSNEITHVLTCLAPTLIACRLDSSLWYWTAGSSPCSQQQSCLAHSAAGGDACTACIHSELWALVWQCCCGGHSLLYLLAFEFLPPVQVFLSFIWNVNLEDGGGGGNYFCGFFKKLSCVVKLSVKAFGWAYVFFG